MARYNKYYGGKKSADNGRYVIDRMIPSDTDLEEAILGAAMMDKDAYLKVRDILSPDSFYDPVHEKIFLAISQLGQSQRPIDMLTVAEQLRANGDLEYVGGLDKINNLTSKTYSSANVVYHARIVAQKSLARQLIYYANAIEAKAFDESYDVDDLLYEAESNLFNICQKTGKSNKISVPFKQTNTANKIVEVDLIRLRQDLEKCTELPQNWSVWAHNNGYNDEVAELIKTILAAHKIVRGAAYKSNKMKMVVDLEQRYAMSEIVIGTAKQIDFARNLRYNTLTCLSRQLKKLTDLFPNEESRTDFIFSAAKELDQYIIAKDVIELLSKVNNDPYKYFQQHIH